LARVHPCLIAVERTVGGYSAASELARGWFDLHPTRGLAGYGLARALRILLDALAGLSALEETRTDAGQPFVHGELVPAMIRIDRSGTARLMPLAPWHWAEPGRLPASDRCGHLAPERLLGDAIDARADVFSAGALLWEALAGRRLFETDSVDGIVTRLMGDKVTLPELPPELSWAAPLKAVAMCALSVDPEQRFANCAELAAAIDSVAGDQIATHQDVASYFSAPHEAMCPSVVARSTSLSTHHSSLSALVAPVEQSLPAPARRLEPVTRNPSLPDRRAHRTLWAIAAISCLVSAFGVSAVARYKAVHDESHSAARSAPPLAPSLPVAPQLASATPQLPSAAPQLPSTAPPLPSTAPSALAAPISVEPAGTAVETPATVELAMPRSDSREKAAKSPKGAAKGAVPKLKAPAKPARSAERTAVKYGI